MRKTAPKEVPFKCYIYCTKGDDLWLNLGASISLKSEAPLAVRVNKKVIGEFICDKVYNIEYLPKEYEGNSSLFPEFICNNSCLSFEQIMEYKNGKTLYGWHISDLKIYDKPKELREFYKLCPTEERGDCLGCDCFFDTDYGGFAQTI